MSGRSRKTRAPWKTLFVTPAIRAGGDVVWVRLVEIDGRPLIDLRRWGFGDGDAFYPTRRGVTLPAETAWYLVEALISASAELQRYFSTPLPSPLRPPPERLLKLPGPLDEAVN